MKRGCVDADFVENSLLDTGDRTRELGGLGVRNDLNGIEAVTTVMGFDSQTVGKLMSWARTFHARNNELDQRPETIDAAASMGREIGYLMRARTRAEQRLLGDRYRVYDNVMLAYLRGDNLERALNAPAGPAQVVDHLYERVGPPDPAETIYDHLFQ